MKAKARALQVFGERSEFRMEKLAWSETGGVGGGRVAGMEREDSEVAVR